MGITKINLFEHSLKLLLSAKSEVPTTDQVESQSYQKKTLLAMSWKPCWLHCNLCYELESPNYRITSCGTVFCDSAKCLGIITTRTCRTCRASCHHFSLDEPLPREIKNLFKDTVSLVKTIQRSEGFQVKQITSKLEADRDKISRDVEKIKKIDTTTDKIIDEKKKVQEDIELAEEELNALLRQREALRIEAEKAEQRKRELAIMQEEAEEMKRQRKEIKEQEQEVRRRMRMVRKGQSLPSRHPTGQHSTLFSQFSTVESLPGPGAAVAISPSEAIGRDDPTFISKFSPSTGQLADLNLTSNMTGSTDTTKFSSIFNDTTF